MIDGRTRTCGLIGNPVEHTMSPLIHNTLAKTLGHNLIYVPFHVEKGLLSDAVKGAYALNILGCNVTIPYKSEVIPFLVETDSLAAKIGAVNTLVRGEKGFVGYNTDMLGLYRAMLSDGVNIQDEKVLILGAGGVARAVAFLVAQKGAAQIWILNRGKEKAEALAKEVSEYYPQVTVGSGTYEEIHTLKGHKDYLAIQATSIGMYPNNSEVIIRDQNFYELVHTGYDMIFNPMDTTFMELVRAHGGCAYNGLKMLVYQGIIAYELWNQTEVTEELSLKIYEELQKQSGKG